MLYTNITGTLELMSAHDCTYLYILMKFFLMQ